ncbi:Single-stranded DNA-specific exonuclease [Geoglobus ahangari]|uniref:Single-stranded DNA-specific exonuclease n=1 Tax=Geoglobus ahangari TaxID=113653 RepID=A0A0F7IEN9_9EURY|nr:DHH family phosphoesterase [Geoglobus ahangari]AKG90868.1 Single-stranded DNA-specific exonuclease [Geoglobus ahangari]
MDYIVDERFNQLIDEVAEKFLKKENGDLITVIHHNDADGICSASILKAMLEGINANFELICVEKVYPAVIEKIHDDREGIFIYTDLGGLASHIIEKYTGDNSVSFIIDHHPAKMTDGDKVYILDPELAGVSGDIFISASALNYLFARRVWPEIENYAYIALLGAVGDYHDRYGGVLGFDRYVLNEAVRMGQVTIRLEGVRERYYIKKFGEYADSVARRLTILGAVGYLERGYRDGVEVCFNGFNDRILSKVEKLEKMKEEKFRSEIERLMSGGMNETEHIQWFSVEDRFDPMGVKTIGEFCQLIKDMSFMKPTKYLIGFQHIPPVIPDLGRIDWKGVKVSGRTPSSLERMILNGKMPGLDILIPKASQIVGGYADATHKIAAATVIDMGREEEFIQAMEEVLRDEGAEAG